MDKLQEKLSEVGSSKICPVIAILRNDQMVVGMRHYTPDKWQTISVWTIPGGRCDEGERVEETLRRETAEETGIVHLTVTSFLGEVVGAKEGDVVYLFIGTTDEEPKLMEPEKFSEWKWMPVGDIPSNFINPRALMLIRDYVRN